MSAVTNPVPVGTRYYRKEHPPKEHATLSEKKKTATKNSHSHKVKCALFCRMYGFVQFVQTYFGGWVLLADHRRLQHSIFSSIKNLLWSNANVEEVKMQVSVNKVLVQRFFF